MYVVVKFGAQEEAVFNSDCKIVSLLDEIRCKCGVEPWAEIELSDKHGNPKDLREHLHQYASEFLKGKEVYILLQVEAEGKGIRYIPLTEDSDILTPEFMERLESRQNHKGHRNGRGLGKRNSNRLPPSASLKPRKSQSRGSIK
ncbi:uncharacterized protein CXorf65 homolog [Watersipora subatra]|uniref:uncharacterized protein CXorf65 homolog n=1 Tax=Watersipora subatra TaxID=2589382 RepID=UPI00355C8FD6